MQLQQVERIGLQILQAAIDEGSKVFKVVTGGYVRIETATGFGRNDNLLAALAFELLQQTLAAKAGRLRRCAGLARRLANQAHARELYRQLLAIAMDLEKMASERLK